MKEHLQKKEHILKTQRQEIPVQCDLNAIIDNDGQINGFIIVFKQKG